MTERPWMKFFPGDWRADPRLRSCSIAARGLWMEMICIMHEATPRGSLLVNGKQVNPSHMLGLMGIAPKDAATLLSELEDAGVFSRDEDGTIYSRRMRREASRSAEAKAYGKLGGNPRLKGGVKPKDKVQTNTYMAFGSGISEVPPTEEGGGSARDEFAEAFWPAWPEHLGEVRAREAFAAARERASLEEILAGLERYKVAKPIRQIWMSAERFLTEERWRDEPAKQPTSPEVTEPVAWLPAADARWGALSARWQREKGAPLRPYRSKHARDPGAFVPSDWLEKAAA